MYVVTLAGLTDGNCSPKIDHQQTLWFKEGLDECGNCEERFQLCSGCRKEVFSFVVEKVALNNRNRKDFSVKYPYWLLFIIMKENVIIWTRRKSRWICISILTILMSAIWWKIIDNREFLRPILSFRIETNVLLSFGQNRITRQRWMESKKI